MLSPEMRYADNFYSLIDLDYSTKKRSDLKHYTTQVKKRNCLRCQIPFISSNHANRCCGSCVYVNNKAAQLKIDSQGL